MSQNLRRNVYPMEDWVAFLQEGKEEFQKLVELRSDTTDARNHLDFIRTIGKGGFGRVMLAKSKDDQSKYAVKVLEKEIIVQRKQVKHAFSEKRILQALNHPFTIYLDHSFQDNCYIYFVLPFIEGGDMFVHLRKTKRFSEALSRFYAAQILLALEYLHYCSMIFRDLKPENILIDRRGYLKLTDFGFCKVVKTRTYSMCGTPDYLAPEVILSKGYGNAVDWWSYGVLLFEMNIGYPPFYASDPMRIYEKAIAGKYAMPKKFSPELKNLIENTIQVDITRRYGNLLGGPVDIKSHKWFTTINWVSLFNGKVEPPFVPPFSSGDVDSNYFEIFNEIPLISLNSDPYKKIFEDF